MLSPEYCEDVRQNFEGYIAQVLAEQSGDDGEADLDEEAAFILSALNACAERYPARRRSLLGSDEMVAEHAQVGSSRRALLDGPTTEELALLDRLLGPEYCDGIREFVSENADEIEGVLAGGLRADDLDDLDVQVMVILRAFEECDERYPANGAPERH